MEEPLFVKDTADLLAVVPNSHMLCDLYGYHDELEVSLSLITVFCSPEPWEDYPVGEGKYKSALWVKLAYDNAEEDKKAFQDGKYSFLVTDEIRKSARRYFGENICHDAKREDTKHKFVRAILYKKGAVIVSFTTR